MKSKYSKLFYFLRSSQIDCIDLTMDEIEEILEFKLPASAYNHRAWWSNSKSHSQSSAWLDVGFKVDFVVENEKSIQKITFTKTNYNNLNVNHSHKNKIDNKKDKINCKDYDLIEEKFIIDEYEFIKNNFVIEKYNISNCFLGYNKYTVKEMIDKEKYKNLKGEILEKYSIYLDWNIQDFMEYLLCKEDELYKKFLNNYGYNDFCQFKLIDTPMSNKRGLYVYVINNSLKYIGRCRDSFKKRFNVNYGKISPRNCYKDGQSTNCHINSLVNKYRDVIKIYLLHLDDENKIVDIEKELIAKYRPDWNNQYT